MTGKIPDGRYLDRSHEFVCKVVADLYYTVEKATESTAGRHFEIFRKSARSLPGTCKNWNDLSLSEKCQESAWTSKKK